MHWREMTSRSLLTFNAHQQARYEWVLRSIGDIHGKTVVDLGAGDGALTSLLVRAGGTVIAIDNEPEGIALGKEIFAQKHLEAQWLLGSVEEAPLPDACADIVVSCDVIEHLDKRAEHVREAARILKPGGIFVCTTPYRICETPAPFHVHEFYPSELIALAEPCFSEVSVRETHHMFWNALYCYRPTLLRRFNIGHLFVNIMTLWFRCNPFLTDSTHRRKRDYYTHLVLRAVK